MFEIAEEFFGFYNSIEVVEFLIQEFEKFLA
jgi:hypothetical protein